MSSIQDSIWIDIKPGDIGFTRGSGFVGWLIRHGTSSKYAHCFIYVHKLNDGWLTVEAYPSRDNSKNGVQLRHRTQGPDKVIRTWRDKAEQGAIITKSISMIGVKYGWGEIFRIALRLAGIKIKGWESDKAVICSNHVAQSVIFSDYSLKDFIAYPPSHIYPGELAANLDGVVWCRARNNDKSE
jgi:hypothetical protein